MKRLPILTGSLLLLLSLLLIGCGQLEFGVETRLTSGKPDPVTVVVTATQQIADNMALVTVTPATTAETPTPTASLPPLTETATASPTATPTETATPTPTAIATSRPSVPTATPVPPQVLSFSAFPSIVTLNSTVTASWTAEGQSALLCVRFVSGWTDNCYTVPLSGSHTVMIEDHFREDILLELEVTGSSGAIAYASIYLPLDCPDDLWFFDDPPASCPRSEAVDTYAAVQRFENGWMLWLEETDTIYAFFEPQRSYSVFYSGFGDPDDPAASNSDYDPPEGLTVPVRGFGLVWRNYSYIRMQLGWALAPELGFETTYQSNADPTYGRTFLLDDDGRLVELDTYFLTWSYR